MGPFVAQALAALVANLTIVSAGMIFGWPSPSLPKLLQQPDTQYDESELRITPEEASWVVSLVSFGAIIGPLLSSLVVDRIGRKWSLNIVAVPLFISWLIIGLATSAEMLYLGRFIGGLSIGTAFGVMSMYVGEIAEDKIRGALGTLMSICPLFGQLISFCIGPWVSRQVLAGISAIPVTIFLIVFPWMPESPYFLLMTGAREKAAASLVWLRRRSDVKEELASLEMIVIEEQKRRDGFGVAELLRKPENRKAFLISLCLMSIQQFSGLLAIMSYASLIFESSGLTGWSSLSVIIMGSVEILAGISVIFVVDLAGRRPILILSASFTAFFLIVEAAFFHVKYLGYETSSFSWVPLVGLVGFQLSFTPGIGCVPWVMIGELFPTNVKAPATMLLAMSGSLMGFIVTKIFESIVTAIGIHWLYYAFATTTLSGALFVYVFVPETKKLSLDAIQAKLNSSRSINPKIPIGDSRETIVTH